MATVPSTNLTVRISSPNLNFHAVTGVTSTELRRLVTWIRRALNRVIRTSHRPLPGSVDLSKDLKIVARSARALQRCTHFLRLFQDRPVCSGRGIFRSSACEAAIHFYQVWVRRRKHPNPGAVRPMIRRARYLQAMVEQEISKALLALSAVSTPEPAVETPPAAAPKSEHPYQIRRRGKAWHVRFAEEEGVIIRQKGMKDIAALLAKPGTPISAEDLMLLDQPEKGTERRSVRPLAELGEHGAAAGESEQPDLDQAGLAAWKQGLEDLTDELEEAKRNNDHHRMETIAEKRLALLDMYEAGKGLGNRRKSLPRCKPAGHYTAVKHRVTRAIAAIEEAGMPGFAAHLRSSIITGAHFVYQPGQDAPRWEF